MINPLRQRMSDDDWSAVAVPRHVATIWRLNVWHLKEPQKLQPALRSEEVRCSRWRRS
jgi:hypothetical protein